MQIVRVGDLTRYLKDLLESDETLSDLWVAGEVSNLVKAPSGHLYFTIKDAASQLSCVMWKTYAARLAQLPQNGTSVIVHGSISVYMERGAYQLYADTLRAEGVGLLAAQFEELKARLQEEGLFDEAHKRPLPRLPQRIGLVTSASGAVLHDIVNVLRRRYPLAHVVVAPAAVQGADAPPQIVAALADLQALGNIDVIIVARGGGSLEDLWGFNDESVARAIYASAVPVISAVGHQVDFTIADFVADLRAPTPSAAAELVAPDCADLASQIASLKGRLQELVVSALAQSRSSVQAEVRALVRVSPGLILDQERQRVDDLWLHLRTLGEHDLALRRQKAEGLTVHLRALSPLAVLERGFAIVRRDGREIVTRVQQVQTGDRLQVRVSDGQFGALVGDNGRGKRRSKADDSPQLSLGL